MYYITKKYRLTNLNLLIIFVIIYTLSVSQASRFIALNSAAILYFNFFKKENFIKNTFFILAVFFTLGFVTLARSYMYEMHSNNLLEVIAAPLIYDFGFGWGHWIFFLDSIDQMLLRLGGLNEAYHVHEMINSHLSCANFDTFLSTGRVCENIGLKVFNLQEPSEFNMNLSISSQFLLLYSVPKLFVDSIYFIVINLALGMVCINLFSGEKPLYKFLLCLASLNLFLGHYYFLGLQILFFYINWIIFEHIKCK